MSSVKDFVGNNGYFKGDVSYEDHSFVDVVDCSLGNSFSKTVDSNFTLSFINVPLSGFAYLCVLKMVNSGDYTITFPTEVKWSTGTIPTFTSGGIDTMIFYTLDGGSTWYANATLGYN
jgi:hypothetical protein